MGLPENGISVVVPSWNGVKLLGDCLPTVRAALDKWGGASEVIVVDDSSTDGTAEFLQKEHPWVLVEKMNSRHGFVHAANRGIRAARHEYVCMLNNDMQVEPDFFGPLAERLDADTRLFAVSAKALQVGTGKLNIGRRVRRIENNTIIGIGDEIDSREAGYTLFASGGASLFRKSVMLSLGCFDEMYAPFYTEDTDLGYRAWKRGWLIIYEPRSVAHHIGGASIGKKGSPIHVRLANKVRISSIINRNAILFYIKNFNTPEFWAAYKRKIAWWTLTSFLKLRWTYLLGMIMAVPRLGVAFGGRRAELAASVRDDYQVYALLNETYAPEAKK